MHTILFYKNSRGEEPVYDYLRELGGRGDKDSRIKLGKIRDYIKLLEQYGTQIGEPYVKHLEGAVWELRPLRDRIFFAGYTDGSYVLLHSFVKKTRRTPAREIRQAKREYADFAERSMRYGS